MRTGTITETLQGRRLTHLLGFGPRPATSPAPLQETPATGRRGLQTRTPREMGLPPRSKMAAFGLPSFQERPSCPEKRDKDIATPRSGNLHEAAATPGPPGGDFTLSSAGKAGGGGRNTRKAAQPAFSTQRVDTGKPAPSQPLFSSPAPNTLLSA